MPHSQCGALLLSYGPHKNFGFRINSVEGDKEKKVTWPLQGCSHLQHSPKLLAGRVGFEPTHLLIENQAA